jgi:hypothetical protein
MAPHLAPGAEGMPVSAVLRSLLERAAAVIEEDEASYLGLIEDIVANGTLSERIRARLEPFPDSTDDFRRALREVYSELADCLERNEPWQGRQTEVPLQLQA